jgi:phosphoglycolate phosphatase-like HAD superfamily hydrolase
MKMHVLFFDIDGTLIDSDGAGDAAMQAAFAEEFGMATRHDIPVHGRTDRAIAGSLFTIHGIEDSAKNWDRLRRSYLHQLARHLPRRQGRALAGVPELLEKLGGRDDVAIGLLTGNVHEAARTKLTYFNLLQHFPFGGFGDAHTDRNDVAREALETARLHVTHGLSSDRVWVVGDTPKDIECARAIQACAVGVATGIYSLEQLQAAGADLVLADLSDPTPLLRLIV